MMKTKGVLLLAVLAFVIIFTNAAITGAQQVPPRGVKIAPAPQTKPGSWWALKMWDVNLMELMVTERLSKTGMWSLFTDLDHEVTFWSEHSPFLSFYSFPLWEGKKWKVSLKIHFEREELVIDGEAKRWEPLKVHGGSFHALRIEMEFHPRSSKLICWYVVEIQHPARCISLDLGSPWYNFEVVAFDLAKGDTQ